MKTNKLILLAIMCSLILTSCIDVQKTPEQIKQELIEAESAESPWMHFKITNFNMYPNKIAEETWFSDAEYDGYIVEGTIKNTSTAIKYKDVAVVVTTLSQTETALEVFRHTVYEYFNPNVDVPFRIKVKPTKEFKYYRIVAVTATKIN